jgi:hypothetical protein
MTHVYNLFGGGSCIEDIARIQNSTPLKRVLGAERVPDPTTAGDFLRRFGPKGLRDLEGAIDVCRVNVWRALPKGWHRRATVDVDSTIKEVYGECKEGADFSYTGKWSYHVLLATLAETGECLRAVNRPGNAASAEGAEGVVREVFELVAGTFRQVYLRGDSKFCQREIVRLCEDPRYHVRFALVKEDRDGVRKIAESLAENAWEAYSDEGGGPGKRASRRKRLRHRARIVRRRRYRTLRTVRQWVAEASYSFAGGVYRLVIKRQKVEERTSQGELFPIYIYRYVLTNIRASEMGAAKVLRFAYARCNQENAIEQAKNGLKALRMPTGTLLANAAFLLAAVIAWSLRTWLSLLALPRATLRWEWKRFRHTFVYIAARVISAAREVVVRISASDPSAQTVLQAIQCLRGLAFG